MIALTLIASFVLLLSASVNSASSFVNSNSAPLSSNYGSSKFNCSTDSVYCTEVSNNIGYWGTYTGHDEPSLLFYDNQPNSGNSMMYSLRLPKDPPTLPTQDGTGGTFNFMLHPAFWFGMAMCDTLSYPLYASTCTPDSDSNIFNSPDPHSPDYIGHHPGTAFMEMQFYPPGWAPFELIGGISCSATQWCAALNIDSYQQDGHTGAYNNLVCQNFIGVEPVNFAFITYSGKSQAPANPVDSTAATYTPNSKLDLFMNSGDWLTVSLFDTPAGFKVVINDMTSGKSGSMTASIANGFGHAKFDPDGSTCNNIPYAFHPMYSTSSPDTRVPWAAHSYNIAFSDEIGHFEYCNTVNTTDGSCLVDGVHDLDTAVSSPLSEISGNEDDFFCLPSSISTRIQISGCAGTDVDFDGIPYQANWPGTNGNPAEDQLVHPQPVIFSSPLFETVNSNGGVTWANYQAVAFETDLPRIEGATVPNCLRLTTGANCVNPPVGASFYPIYTIGTLGNTLGGSDKKYWQLGGAWIPGTTNLFGGSSTTEYGPILRLFYQSPHSNPSIYKYEDFRLILNYNPNPAPIPSS